MNYVSDPHPASIPRIDALSLIGCEPDAITLATETGAPIVIT